MHGDCDYDCWRCSRIGSIREPVKGRRKYGSGQNLKNVCAVLFDRRRGVRSMAISYGSGATFHLLIKRGGYLFLSYQIPSVTQIASSP